MKNATGSSGMCTAFARASFYKMSEFVKKINEAIRATKEEDYLRGLTVFLDVYGTEDTPQIAGTPAATGLSYFGLCLALVQRKFKPAIDLCKRAIDLQFYNGDHYANLARVYVAAGNRKKAVEVADQGLKLLPDHEELIDTRRFVGVRSRPPVPFLDRSHPINVSLGQARHAKKLAERPPRRKR
jgi:tetratricopeptide (TPR) repeat protein